MKKLLGKFTIVLLVIMISLSFIGCSSSSKNNSNDKKQTQDAKNQNKEETDIKEDKKNTDNLKAKKEVSDAKVYTQNGNAIAAIVIKDDVSESDAKALAEDYSKQLKKKYSNMKIYVQAVQKGKCIADITINK